LALAGLEEQVLNSKSKPNGIGWVKDKRNNKKKE
jgi:hypothetical protein